MGCAPLTSPHLQLTARQNRLLARIWANPGATTRQLTGRFSNPAITRIDLAALIEASLVVPVTTIEHRSGESSNITLGVAGRSGHRSTSTVHTTIEHTDRDAARNGELRWRTTRPGNRYHCTGNLTDISDGSRGQKLNDWWLCPRGIAMRNEALARLRTHEAPLGALPGVEQALEAAAWGLTAIANETDAYRMLGEPWPELTGATPTDVANTGGTADQLRAAAEAHVERHTRTRDTQRQRRLNAATGDEAHIIATVTRLQDRWGPQQGWCCGTVTYRSLHI